MKFGTVKDIRGPGCAYASNGEPYVTIVGRGTFLMSNNISTVSNAVCLMEDWLMLEVRDRFKNPSVVELRRPPCITVEYGDGVITVTGRVRCMGVEVSRIAEVAKNRILPVDDDDD